MKSKQYSPNETVAWRNLEALAQDSTKTTIADLFKSETDRAEKNVSGSRRDSSRFFKEPC